MNVPPPALLLAIEAVAQTFVVQNVDKRLQLRCFTVKFSNF